MKRGILLLLLIALLLAAAPCAQAAETDDVIAEDIAGKDLDTILGGYMEANGLDAQNCAIGWYDTGTGESWYFGADTYWPAASMYKLPLCMAITDRLADGTLSPDDLADGYTIDTAMYMTIVYSNNETAQALRYKLSENTQEYRNILAGYSGIPTEELPESFYTDNCMSPRFILETLKALYADEEHYAQLIELLKQATPGHYFQLDQGDFIQGDYTVAHKYGYFEGLTNDCAIVYTPQPLLLCDKEVIEV